MPFKFNPLTGNLDLVRGATVETDPLSLHLDQTTPQTIENGIPLIYSGRIYSDDNELVDKLYVDTLIETGYVPYTGATTDVDLGTHDLTTTGTVTANDFDATSGYFQSDVEKVIGPTPEEVENEGFEDWTSLYEADYWGYFDDVTDEASPQRSDDSHGGDYAVEFFGGGDLDNFSGFQQTFSGLTPDDEYSVSFWAKGSSLKSMYVAYTQNFEQDYDTYWWNFTLGQWDNLNPNFLTNGNFESWTLGVPDSWTVMETSANGSVAEDTSDPYAGTSCAKLTADATGGVIIYQAVTGTGISEGDSVDFAFNHIGAVGGESFYFFFLNGAGDQIYNFTTYSWDAYVGGLPSENQLEEVVCGTVWNDRYRDFPMPADEGFSVGFYLAEEGSVYLDEVSVSEDNGPSADYLSNFELTSSWAEYTTEVGDKVKVPASGGFEIIIGTIDDGVLLDDISLSTGGGASIITNGNFEDWTEEAVIPDDWEIEELEDNDNYEYEQDGEEQRTGTYCIKTINQSNRAFVTQLINETVGEYYFSVWAKTDLLSANDLGVIFLNNDAEDATQIWNFSDEEWETYSGTIPTTPSDNVLLTDLTDTYANVTATIEAPSNGNINIILFGNSSGSYETPLITYIDDVSFKSTALGPPITLFEFTNTSDYNDLDKSDIMVKFNVDNGVDSLTAFKVKGDGSISNDQGTFVSGVNTGDQTLESLGAQAQLNGTGFVRANGTYITYDNTTYLIAESDPVFSSWLLNTPPIYSETDPIFNQWLLDTPPLYSETDPIFSGWLETTPPIYSETDPVFSASDAFAITSTQISNWDIAYGWGDHAGLYDLVGAGASAVSSHELAYDHTLIATALQSETDPVFSAWLIATPPLYSETDPVFTAWLGTVTPANWDTAYEWGDHSLAGYLTAETDPVFTSSDAFAITSTQISNWDTAYLWGNHADAGYLTSVTAHNLLSTTHGDTTAGTVARGDLVTGQGSSAKWAKLALPATPTGKVLTNDGTDVVWSSNPLTIGASASVSGSNTGDQDLSGYVTTSQTVGQTIGDTTNRLTKLWATNITVTNAITGSVTGNAGTVTVGSEGSDTTCFPLFGTSATGSLSPKTNAGLTFNSSTGLLYSTGLSTLTELVGSDANFTDFPKAKLVVSNGDTGHTYDKALGAVIEVSSSTDFTTGLKIYSKSTNSYYSATGLVVDVEETSGGGGGYKNAVRITYTTDNPDKGNIHALWVDGGGGNAAYMIGDVYVSKNFQLSGRILAGSGNPLLDYDNAKILAVQDDVNESNTANIGIVATAVAENGVNNAMGVRGVASTDGANAGFGVVGRGMVTDTADTGIAYGGYFYTNETHAGGKNIALHGDASGGATNIGLELNITGSGTNYAFNFTGSEKGHTAEGNSGFVSNSTGTFTVVGYIKIAIDETNTYYMPYGTIA